MTTLVFSRPHNLFLMPFRWYVFIDGNKAGYVKNNSFAEFAVAPGGHEIELRCYDTFKLIPGKYIYSKPLAIDVADNETTAIEIAPHPLWNFSHRMKLFSRSESLILIPAGQKYAAICDAFEQERKTVQHYLNNMRPHSLTVIATVFSALYLILTSVIAGAHVHEELSLPFFCGIVSITGLISARYNKFLLVDGFEWKHPLLLGLLLISTVLFDMTNPYFAMLKNTYFLLALIHLGISMFMYKKRPALRF